MPLKGDQKRAYQREYVRKRRAAYLAEAGPCRECGSTTNLQFDHIDASQKVSHRIWSWSHERIAVELEKCQVLCEPCHLQKSREAVDGTRRFTAQERQDIRDLYATDQFTLRSLAARYGTGPTTIWKILHQRR